MNDNIHLKKYLKKRSIHKVVKPHKQIQRNNYKFFIVIPCYNEFEYIFDTQKVVLRTLALKRIKCSVFISATAAGFFSDKKIQ